MGWERRSSRGVLRVLSSEHGTPFPSEVPLSGCRTARDLFHESSTKELGRLEAQLGALRQELEALGLRQSSADERLGLFPQQIQALRDDVSLTCQL